MKIYTKSGDKGITSLCGGKRIAKNDIQVEAYGCIDELNSFVGLIICQDIMDSDRKHLITLQESLFIIGQYLSSDYSEKTDCILKPNDISKLEKEIDKISTQIEPLKNFVLPTGNQAVSFCHISRTVCRRTERIIISLNDKKRMDKNIIIYLNRLSDYLFVLARKISKDFGLKESIINIQKCK
jgi:cob(I)alamin adenosyltransferase